MGQAGLKRKRLGAIRALAAVHARADYHADRDDMGSRVGLMSEVECAEHRRHMANVGASRVAVGGFPRGRVPR